MKIETLIKLKEAGFRMRPIGALEPHPIVRFGFGDEYVQPTLEELIDACGDRFQELCAKTEYTPAPWTAYSRFENRVVGEGETPSEAVADLYLLLNKKKDEVE